MIWHSWLNDFVVYFSRLRITTKHVDTTHSYHTHTITPLPGQLPVAINTSNPNPHTYQHQCHHAPLQHYHI